MNKQRKFFRISEKIEILDHFHKIKNLDEIVKIYSVNKSTFANWKNNEAKIRRSCYKKNKYTLHPGPKNKSLEKEIRILKFIEYCEEKKIEKGVESIINYAKRNFDSMKNKNRKYFLNWIAKFFKKYNLKEIR